MIVFRAPHTGALQCAHTSTKTELLPPESRHFAKLKCADCGAFLKFLPRPENVERRKLNGFKLAKLQMCDGLSSWEREFIESLAKQGSNKLTPKQQAVFDRLCLTYLERRAA
jgi:hypothetical protein